MDPQTLPPALSFNPLGRDDDTVTHASILLGVLAARTNDDIQHHQITDLPSIYLHDQIRCYDVISAGFDESADLLAAQIPGETGVSKYLDLGTGSAKTATACIQTLASNNQIPKIYVVDGLPAMLSIAVPKIQAATPATVNAELTDVLRGDGQLRALLLGRYGMFDLITAQRVLINCRFDRRVDVLREWASSLAPGGTMIVDCPHPARDLAALFVGPSRVDPSATKARWYRCYQIGDRDTFEECREYARDLAAQTGLQIVNNMPAQLPQQITDAQAEFGAWVASTRSSALTGVLSRDELRVFRQRYSEQMQRFHHRLGIKLKVDLAAVVVAFQRPSTVPPAAPSTPATIAAPVQGSTKWGVDEALHGNAREMAKKAARRKAKRAEQSRAKKGHDGKKGDDDMDGAGGEGSKVCEGVDMRRD
ncbi:MAG: hypothetical protein LQ349_000314 [Xanthoria aureola]|nr:MAG: hypothetical protein LQ349_000314 [Xanthoria aureola]